MTEAEDRLVAAAFMIQLVMTDATLYEQSLSVTYALSRLLQQREDVLEVLKIFESVEAARTLLLWCRQRMKPPAVIRPGPLARAKRLAGRLLPPELRGIARYLRVVQPSIKPPDPIRAALGNVAVSPDGLAMRLLASQDAMMQECKGWERRRRIAGIYLDGLDRNRLVVPLPPRPPACWIRFPLAWRCHARERDRRCREIGDALNVEIGPFNWSTPVHLVSRLRSVTRVGPGIEETVAMIDGLVNLPVHSQVSERLAKELVERVNRAAAR